MDCYLVVFKGEDDASFIEEAFENSYQFSDSAWVIAPPDRTTCSDLVDKLKEHVPDPTCMVVKLTEYNGWAEQGLWEKIMLWASE